jgi:hypothetical protein
MTFLKKIKSHVEMWYWIIPVEINIYMQFYIVVLINQGVTNFKILSSP